MPFKHFIEKFSKFIWKQISTCDIADDRKQRKGRKLALGNYKKNTRKLTKEKYEKSNMILEEKSIDNVGSFFIL